MGSVWVGKVASHINLMRLYLLQQGSYHLYVLLCHRQLLNFSTLIEWQIKEVYMVERNLIIGAGSASLTTANQSLDGQDVAGIEIALLLVGEEFLNLLVLLRDNAVLGISENLVEAVDEVHESCYLLVAYSDVTRCFVSHVNLVLLLNQSADSTTH